MTQVDRSVRGTGTDGSGVRAVDAATVLLLRDGAGGPEVLLLERHLDSDFAGGALVFPGGKVDAADRTLEPALWRGTDPARWVDRLGVAAPEDALGLLVAAVRETFEEAGVLLATRRDGSPVTAADLADPGIVAERAALAALDDHRDWRPFLREHDLVLDLGALVLWSWWVTPEGQHRRFDTRFFAARLPAGQHADHDDVEMTSVRWSQPLEAIAAHEAGTAMVIYPTRRNLLALAGFASVDAALDGARRGEVDTRRIQPTVVVVDGTPMVQHPDGGAPEPV